MTPRRLITTSIGTLLALAFLHSGGGAGCGGGQTPPDLSDVVYEGVATDEALEAMLVETVEDVSSKHVTLTAPAGGTLAPDAPISWSFAATARVDGPKRSRGVDWLREMVGPMKSAYAHGDPVNGQAWLVELSAGATRIYRVFTTDATHTPDAAHFAMLQGKGPIQACVTGAIFEENEVAADGGPYVGGCFELTVE